MKKTIICILSCITLFTVYEPVAGAGQVVTDSDRAWARTVVEQEKSRDTIVAPNTLAVLYFRNTTGETRLNPLQKGFALLLMTDLSQVEGIQLVERVKFQALAEELNLGASGIVDSATAPRVGKLLGASYLVGGDLKGAQAPQIGIVSNLLQVKDQNSLGQPSANGQEEQIFDMEKKILFEIIDLLKIKLTKVEKETLKRPQTLSYRALIFLAFGLDASDRGNYAAAAVYYQKALEQDPQFKPAQNALKELLDLRLVTINPRSYAILKGEEAQNSSALSTDRNFSTFREFRPATSGEIRVRW
jgi:TolB-like protein